LILRSEPATKRAVRADAGAGTRTGTALSPEVLGESSVHQHDSPRSLDTAPADSGEYRPGRIVSGR